MTEQTVKKIKKLAKRNLSEKRYTHTVNVAKMAKKLAKINNADVLKARAAAYLHDLLKEQPKDVLLQMLEDNGIIKSNTKEPMRPACVWHGICAAIYAKEKLGIDDEEVLSAVACHTSGKKDMSLMDKIIFLADMVSAERSFDGVEPLRRLAQADLEEAMIKALKMNIDMLSADGRQIDVNSVQALESLLNKGGLAHNEQ